MLRKVFFFYLPSPDAASNAEISVTFFLQLKDFYFSLSYLDDSFARLASERAGAHSLTQVVSRPTGVLKTGNKMYKAKKIRLVTWGS